MSDIKITIIDREGEAHTVDAPTDMNMNLMEVIRSYELAPEGTIGICGGMAMCASCQCYVLNLEHMLPEQSFEEVFSITGVYLVSFNTMDVFVMLLIAMGAIALRLANFPLAPLLLGFILGGLMEENLRRALMISDGELSFLWERPITLAFTVLAVLVLSSPLLVKLISKLKSTPTKVTQ